MPEVLSKYNRGIMATPCPTCGALQNQRCRPASGTGTSRPMAPHTARVAASQGALLKREMMIVEVAMIPRQTQVALIKSGVTYLGQIETMTWEDLLDLRNFGVKSLAWCILAMEHMGSDLAEHSIPWRHPVDCKEGTGGVTGKHCNDLYPCWRRNLEDFLEAMHENYPPPRTQA